MKQKDIALILVVSFISGIFSLFISNMLLGGSSKRNLTSDVVTAINTDFKQPNKKYFNESSVDPTQIIRIGDNTNAQPFN